MAIPKFLQPVLQDVTNPPPVTTPPPATTPTTPVTGPTGTFGGLAQEGEMPWITQQRNMLLGFADRDNWPDWIRAQYGLPPRDPNAAASPYIEQITNQQRRQNMIAQQGARLRAARPAAAAPAAVPTFLNSVLPPGGAEGGFAAPPVAANPYPMLTALSEGGDLNSLGAGGGGSAAAPASGIPSIGVAPAPPRRSLFS